MSQATIKLKDIDFGDRIREDYGDLDSLAQSINDRGLINPLTVSVHPKYKGKYILAAGGRRFHALRLLEKKEAMCRIYDHVLSKLELMSIEAEENLKRKNLSYDEECRQAKILVITQEKLHGKKTSTSPDAPGVSMRDTAKLINISHTKLQDDIALANAMEEFPELGLDKCKNRSEAFKLKAKAENMIVRKALSEIAEKKLNKNGGIQATLISKFIIGNFFKGVEKIPDNYFNLVEIDPPYSMNLKKMKKSDGFSKYNYGNDGYEEIDPKDYPDFMQEVFRKCYKKMATNSWLICWFAPEPWFEQMFSWIIKAGFKCRRITGEWVKPSGQLMSPRYHMASCHENFFYARKGSPEMCVKGRSNVFQYAPIPPKQKDHPTARPLGLMIDILGTFTHENSNILIPFAGSGNTLIAAAKCKMMPIGFDLTAKYKEGYILNVQEEFKGG